MPISCAPASSAASRATLPWLCPCRTSHKRSGQFCRIRTSSCGRKHQREDCALRLLGGNRGLESLLLVDAAEGGERLTDDLVHIVIAIGCEPPDKGDVVGRIRQRLVALEQLLILGPRDRIIRIAFG